MSVPTQCAWSAACRALAQRWENGQKEDKTINSSQRGRKITLVQGGVSTRQERQSISKHNVMMSIISTRIDTYLPCMLFCSYHLLWLWFYLGRNTKSQRPSPSSSPGRSDAHIARSQLESWRASLAPHNQIQTFTKFTMFVWFVVVMHIFSLFLG